MNSDIEKVINKVDPKNRASIQEAANALIGLNSVVEGDTVTVTDDSTLPYEGQTGKVITIDRNSGMAMVKFPNAADPVPMMVNLLIPIK